ncbi:MAG: hypothetical protein R6V19_04770 [Armatimonadota bacterium]
MMKLDYEKLQSFDKSKLLEYEEEIEKRAERQKEADAKDSKGKKGGRR